MMTPCVIVAFLVSFAFPGPVHDGAARGEETVSVAARLSYDGVRAGSSVRAALILRIQKGWHINSASPFDENLVATAAAFAPPPGLAVTDTLYPPGFQKRFAFSESPLDVYEGSVIIRLKISVSGDVRAGVYEIPVEVSYQACNNDFCLAPATVRVVIPVNVVGPDQSPAPVNPGLFSGWKDM